MNTATLIDRIAIEAIATAPTDIDSRGRRTIAACGGTFTKWDLGHWSFDADGRSVGVTVPSTIAALEDRLDSNRGMGVDGVLADVRGGVA